MPRVNYLGLNMDTAMVAKIVAALRGLYPNLVSPTDSDNRVVQICLRQIITDHLATWAARSAADPDAAAKQAFHDARAAQDTAEQQARTDAGDIAPTATT